jgi:hypothetical protein
MCGVLEPPPTSGTKGVGTTVLAPTCSLGGVRHSLERHSAIRTRVVTSAFNDLRRQDEDPTLQLGRY